MKENIRDGMCCFTCRFGTKSNPDYEPTRCLYGIEENDLVLRKNWQGLTRSQIDYIINKWEEIEVNQWSICDNYKKDLDNNKESNNG